jgi:SAM-dependent methyltransferase/uncharacterized protein YbaR (Trm112 family)
MLEAIRDVLACPVCAARDAPLDLRVFARSPPGRVRDGALTCRGCAAWFPIENHLLELVPAALIDRPAGEEFARRHALDPALLGGRPQSADVSAQLKQREHFDWYAGNQDADYKDYAEMPFWRAVDAATFARWRPVIDRSARILDLGSANGRSTFPLVGAGRVVVGFDISKAMIRQAIERAEREGSAERVCFFVGDAARLPFRDASFDCIQTYGVLHHFPDPGHVFHEICRVLKPGGVHLGSENNKTALRGAFDALMRLLPIWSEEAGDEPLISEEMLRGWARGLPLRIESGTMVFLPPHLFNLFGVGVAQGLLSASDAVGRALPWLRDNGGLIVFAATKTG